MSNDRGRVAEAKISFQKLMTWTIVTAVLMSLLVVIFMLYAAGPVSGGMIVAGVLGVFFSVTLGAGLMALGFLSSNSGHDENAADHRDRGQPPER